MRMANQVKRRDPRIDTIKGILIVLVVFGHYLWGYREFPVVEEMVELIYLFHMPAFIFISGFLSKDVLPISWKSIAQLLVSYVLINSLMMFFCFVYRGSDIMLLTPYYSCWYLLALVIWRVTLPFLANHRFALFATVAFSLAIGFSDEVTNKFALARAIAFYPFFIGGFLSKKHGFMERTGSARCRTVGIAVFAGTLFVSYFLIEALGIASGDMLMQSYSKEVLLFDLIRRAVILLLAAVLSVSLCCLVPRKPVPFITKWGKNSLTIYLFHRVFPLLLLGAMPVGQFDGVYWVVMIIGSFATLLVLGSDAVEARYRDFVFRITEVLFADRDDAVYWRKKQSLLTVFVVFALAVLVAQG